MRHNNWFRSSAAALATSAIVLRSALAAPQAIPPYGGLYGSPYGNSRNGESKTCPNLQSIDQGGESQKTTPWPAGEHPDPNPLPAVPNPLPWEHYLDIDPSAKRSMPQPLNLVPRRQDNGQRKFCVPLSATILTINFVGDTLVPWLAERWKPFIMRTAWTVALIARDYDRVINYNKPENEAVWSAAGFSGQRIYAFNYNDHQLTYGVLGAALAGVEDVWLTGNAQLMSMVITDGANDVGRLVLQMDATGG